MSQVFLTLDDKGNRELKEISAQLEAVRRAVAEVEVKPSAGPNLESQTQDAFSTSI